VLAQEEWCPARAEQPDSPSLAHGQEAGPTHSDRFSSSRSTRGATDQAACRRIVGDGPTRPRRLTSDDRNPIHDVLLEQVRLGPKMMRHRPSQTPHSRSHDVQPNHGLGLTSIDIQPRRSA
jgi:hypothetical protein